MSRCSFLHRSLPIGCIPTMSSSYAQPTSFGSGVSTPPETVWSSEFSGKQPYTPTDSSPAFSTNTPIGPSMFTQPSGYAGFDNGSTGLPHSSYVGSGKELVSSAYGDGIPSRPKHPLVALSDMYDIESTDMASDSEMSEARRSAVTDDIKSGKLTFTPFVSAVKTSELSRSEQFTLSSRGWQTSGSAMWKSRFVPTSSRKPYDDYLSSSDWLARDARHAHAHSVGDRITTEVSGKIPPCPESLSAAAYSDSLRVTIDRAASKVVSDRSWFWRLGRHSEISKARSGYHSTRHDRETKDPHALRASGDGHFLRYDFQRPPTVSRPGTHLHFVSSVES